MTEVKARDNSGTYNNIVFLVLHPLEFWGHRFQLGVLGPLKSRALAGSVKVKAPLAQCIERL